MFTETRAAEPDHIEVGQSAASRRIAFLRRAGTLQGRPTLVWLGGYRSDMSGTKAVEIERHAGATGCGCLRFDYSGHGASGGAFRDGTISRWLEESLAVINVTVSGPMVLIGSSMGAWIALRLVQELHARGDAGRIAGLVLIAPAPDFTVDLVEPKLTQEDRTALAAQGYVEEPTPYGPEPNVYTAALIEDGRRNIVLSGIIEAGCPVHILQGMADPDVPFTHALKLMEHLPADDVVMTLIADGDHRLSRPQDIERILAAIDGMLPPA